MDEAIRMFNDRVADHPFSCYVFGLVVCLISMVATSSEFQINKPNLSHDGSLPLMFEAWPWPLCQILHHHFSPHMLLLFLHQNAFELDLGSTSLTFTTLGFGSMFETSFLNSFEALQLEDHERNSHVFLWCFGGKKDFHPHDSMFAKCNRDG